jgi:hypothetical protein
VHDEIAGLDPSSDRTRGDVQTFRDLGDREKSDLIVALTATADAAECSRFPIAVARGLSSTGHVLPPLLRRAWRALRSTGAACEPSKVPADGGS